MGTSGGDGGLFGSSAAASTVHAFVPAVEREGTFTFGDENAAFLHRRLPAWERMVRFRQFGRESGTSSSWRLIESAHRRLVPSGTMSGVLSVCSATEGLFGPHIERPKYVDSSFIESATEGFT